MITYCDVNTCEDCPRYGDDCDGDKRVEHTDTISRADAIKAVASITMSIHLSDVICGKLLALPSAEAKPTVIRSKTLLPTKDFKEWAKRVRETNPNAVVIPCDAEVVYSEAVQEWIPCSERFPEKDGWYLVTVQGYETVTDVSLYSADGSAWGDVSTKQKVTAWMPLPKPYKGGDDE